MAFFIISLLILSAPARAFVLSLSSDVSEIVVGGKIVFAASVNIMNGENIPVRKLVIQFVNDENGEITSCSFNVDGSKISECAGISIRKLTDNSRFFGYNFGYYNGQEYNFGYGYGYKDSLDYEITVDTKYFETGSYSTKLFAYINNQIFSEEGDDIKIKPKVVQPPNPDPVNNNGGGFCVGECSLICLNAWQCTEWSKCSDGYQTRTCGQTRSDCLLSSKPAEERECPIQLDAKINDPSLEFKKITTTQPQTKQTQTNIEPETQPEVQMSLVVVGGGIQMLIILFLMAGIIGLLLAIDIVLFIEHSRRKRRARRLRRIMYKPKKTVQ